MNKAKNYCVSPQKVEEYLKIKNCEICEVHVSGNRHYIDHNHETGELRGVLCPSCNSALGKFHDSQVMLNKAIDYLKKYGSYGL